MDAGKLTIKHEGGYEVEQLVEEIVVMGAKEKPTAVRIEGNEAEQAYDWDESTGTVRVRGLSVDLKVESVVVW